MFEPVRGGTRGGQAEFKWSDVSADKDREHYLGHSINAPTGRWQKNKDVHWYSRDLSEGEKERAEEIRKVKEAEADALAVALGFAPSDKDKDKAKLSGPVSPSAPAPSDIMNAQLSESQRALEKEERRRRKAERKEEKRAKKEARRAEKRSLHDSDDEDRSYRKRHTSRSRSRSRSPVRRSSRDRDDWDSRTRRPLHAPRSRSRSPRLPRPPLSRRRSRSRDPPAHHYDYDRGRRIGEQTKYRDGIGLRRDYGSRKVQDEPDRWRRRD